MREARNLTMSAKELGRLEIIGRVLEHRLAQWKAAEQLGLSLSQVERLCGAYRAEGVDDATSRLMEHGLGARFGEARSGGSTDAGVGVRPPLILGCAGRQRALPG